MGCAAGHGPYAGIPKHPNETWTEYDARVFDLTDDAWSWCFNGNWANHDNTPEGAAAENLSYWTDDE